jgi:hypothetical protein
LLKTKQCPEKGKLEKIIMTGSGTGTDDAGGSFTFDLLSNNHECIMSGDFRQIKKSNTGYFAIDNTRGIIQFDFDFIMFQSKPVLNSDNFIISYLTQLVYGCLMNRKIFEFKIGDKKAKDRLVRNREINSNVGIEFDTNSVNSMLEEFLKIRKNSNLLISEWQKFLSKYYFRMKHEFINKSNKYMLNLEEYL